MEPVESDYYGLALCKQVGAGFAWISLMGLPAGMILLVIALNIPSYTGALMVIISVILGFVGYVLWKGIASGAEVLLDIAEEVLYTENG